MRWNSGGWAVRPIGVVMQANPSAVLLTRQFQEKKRNERFPLLDQTNSRRIILFGGPSKINGYNALLRENTTASKFTRSGYLGEHGGQHARHKAWQGQLAGATTDTSPSHVCASLLFLPVRAVCGTWCWRSFRSARPGWPVHCNTSYGSGFRGRGVCRALKMASVFVSLPYYIVVWLLCPFLAASCSY